MRMFVKGAAVGGIFGALAAAGTVALAGTGVGGVFNLGQANTVNQRSTLSGNSSAEQLKVVNAGTGSTAGGIVAQNASPVAPGVLGQNTSTGPGLRGVSAGIGVHGQSSSATQPGLLARNTGGGPAASFERSAKAGPPFTVNSSGLVDNLNAEFVGGFRAGDTPAPLQLLALDGGGKFPASALPFRIQYARVRADGTLLGGLGVLWASRVGPGQYDVRFDGSIAGCAAVQSITQSGFGPIVHSGEITSTLSSPDVYVDTYDSTAAGGAPPARSDRPFHIAIFC